MNLDARVLALELELEKTREEIADLRTVILSVGPNTQTEEYEKTVKRVQRDMAVRWARSRGQY